MLYSIQLVGNTSTVKRMVASLYLVDAKKKEQVLKVCICDDLPHVVTAVESQQRYAPSHDLLESGLVLQVAFGRRLTIKASVIDDEGLCVIKPNYEVVIPPQAIWESNTAFATDFEIELQRPCEDAAIQVSICSQDDLGTDIPLNVPPRVHISWQPKDMSGVKRIRQTWEMNETQKQYLRPSAPSHQRSGSFPRYIQPLNQDNGKVPHDRSLSRSQDVLVPPNQGRVSPRFQGRISPRNQGHVSPRFGYASKPVSVQDKNWNVVVSPKNVREEENDDDDDLPKWATGHEAIFDYEEIVII